MSYTVDLVVGDLPADQKAAWEQIEALREVYSNDSRAKAPALVALHGVLTARHPCLSSYQAGDPAVDECPWADGPMIGNLAHEMGMLAITFSRVDEVLPLLIREANALGITVADGQSGEIHRPLKSRAPEARVKPWWKFW